MQIGQNQANKVPYAVQLATRIRGCCLRLGWDVGELARRSGVSRTTLYQLQRGLTVRPRVSTLNKISAALEIAPEALCDLEIGRFGPSAAVLADEVPWSDAGHPQAFDRFTNTVVTKVYEDSPELFVDWTEAEWDELYSAFGTGGQLTRQGVAEVADKMNRKRETIRQLHVVLETHLGEVATRMLETLYGMVRSEGNLEETAALAALLAQHRADRDQMSQE